MTAYASRVTIADVAERAGVSIATVSRVVNDRYGVAKATSSRVRAVIEELGYESSLVARSLRSERTNVIGILVADIEPFSAELLKGAAKALHDSDFEMVVYAAGQHGGEGWERRYISRLSGTLTDGTILVTPTVVSVSTTQPVVAVDPHVGGSSLPTIDTQNFEGAVELTEHLLALGHRRIGFLAGRPDLESARRREAGYRAALQSAGIEFDPELVRIGGFTEETAAAPAHELLTMADRATAIFAANDLSAIQTMRTAAELGIRVPEEISIVGFDNIPESALTEPPLTTVDQSIQALGHEAVRTLLDLIERGEPQPTEPVHITLPTKLVVRRTSAPPP
jgi:LacI family transcriptional regulator